MRHAILAVSMGLGVSLSGTTLTHLPVRQTKTAQVEQQNGWLEGTLRKSDSAPVDHRWIVELRLKVKDGEEVTKTSPTETQNSLFSARDLKPGVYEIRVYRVIAAATDNEGYRPQRIWGVIVKPGVRSTLDIILHKGNDLEEIGQPTVATQPVVFISQELARPQKQIDSLDSRLKADSLQRARRS